MEHWTEERFATDNQDCTKFLERAKTLLSTATDQTDRENLEFFISELTIFTSGYKHGGFYFPLNYMEGLHVDFQRLAEWAAPKTVKDYQDIVERYRAFGEQVDQIIETLKSAVKKKITNHAVSMKDVAENCRKLANE